jgi:hypothetical protein
MRTGSAAACTTIRSTCPKCSVSRSASRRAISASTHSRSATIISSALDTSIIGSTGVASVGVACHAVSAKCRCRNVARRTPAGQGRLPRKNRRPSAIRRVGFTDPPKSPQSVWGKGWRNTSRRLRLAFDWFSINGGYAIYLILVKLHIISPTVPAGCCHNRQSEADGGMSLTSWRRARSPASPVTRR